jgi:hypothetical protein
MKSENSNGRKNNFAMAKLSFDKAFELAANKDEEAEICMDVVSTYLYTLRDEELPTDGSENEGQPHVEKLSYINHAIETQNRAFECSQESDRSGAGQAQ